jgi:hypothetical protein
VQQVAIDLVSEFARDRKFGSWRSAVVEMTLSEVAVFEVAVFGSAILKALRAPKRAEGVTGTDCAAMIEICGRV